MDGWLKSNIILYHQEKKIELEWTTDSRQLGATYKDINDKKHYSFMEGNVLSYFDDKLGMENFKEEYKKINYPKSFTVKESYEY